MSDRRPEEEGRRQGSRSGEPPDELGDGRPQRSVLRFDSYEVDPREGELRRGGEAVVLQEKPFMALVALLERPGRLVTRSELQRRLWPEEEFGDFGTRLNVAMVKLRQALGDSSTDPRYIETVRRRGYRFIAAVEGLPDRAVADGGRRRRSPIGPWQAAAGLLLVLVLMAAGFWSLVHRRPVPFDERDWLLIAEFDNLTGDEVLDRSLAAALKTGMRQSRRINVLTDSRIAEALERMGRDPRTAVDEATAVEIALREGARALVVGSVSELGGTYELSARVVSPESKSDLLVVSERAADRDRIIAALDELVVLLRRGLGESRSEVGRERLPLPQATTASLEALRAFADGRALLATEPELALAALEEAIALDPEFALAHAEVGGWYYRHNDRPRGEDHFLQALELVDRLTPRERLWVRAEMAAWRGEVEAAISAYETFLESYPDSARGWFRLGYQHLLGRRCETAEEAFHRSLDLDPTSASPLINIATCEAFRGRYADAIETYEQAFELDPETRTYWTLRELGSILAVAGRPDDAASLFREMLSGGPAEAANGRRGLAFVALLEGRFGEAVDRFREALAIHHQKGHTTSELRVRVFIASALAATGRQRDLERQLDEIRNLVEDRYVEPGYLAVAGKLLARQGRGDALRSIFEKLAQRVNRESESDLACLHLLSGERELLAANLEAARGFFERAVASNPQAHFLESLAETCSQLGRLDCAIESWERIRGQRAWFGYEAQFPWMLARYRLAGLHQRQGDLEQAEDLYQRFVTDWRQGDAELVDLRDARLRLRRLRLGR